MSKKKFANLGLDDALADFVTDSQPKERPAFNPLTDKKPRSRPAKPKKEEPKVSTPKPKQEKVKPESKPVKKQEPKKVVATNKENPFSSYDISEAPKDFKSHSALISAEQRKQLSEIVYYKKYKENPKFTIQFAIYQALEELFKNRQPLNKFPDDFGPYSPGFSVSQWETLEAFVAEIKYKENKGYALKYAIYEALKVYIDDNPIKL